MINTYDEAVGCIDSAIYHYDTAVSTINYLYDSSVSNTRNIRQESAKNLEDALIYANLQTNDIKTYFNRFEALVEASVPNIEKYGNAKEFFEEKKLYKTKLFTGIVCYVTGVAGFVCGNIALACASMAMSATSFQLSKKHMLYEYDERYAKDLRRYERAKDKYQAGVSFHINDMKDFMETLDSYKFALGIAIDKLTPTHSKNGVPDDRLNAIANAYIEMSLFRKNAPQVIDIIMKHKGIEDKKPLIPKIRRLMRKNIESRIEA